MTFLFKSFFLDIQPFFRKIYSYVFWNSKAVRIILSCNISVVVNDIEPNCLVGGIPAKFIKKVKE